MLISLFKYNNKKLNIKDSLKAICILLITFSVFGCSPKVDKVSYQDAFKKWNWTKNINEIDSSASMSIYFNTYRGLFEGRESFLSFKKNIYHIDFTKIDTCYTEKDIEHFSVLGDTINENDFIPKFCKVKIQRKNDKIITIEFEIKDDRIYDLLKGKFKLKLDNRNKEHFDVFKYYTN